MDIRILEVKKQVCEKKIRNALLDLLSNNSITNISVDVEIRTLETQSGEKIFDVKPIITLGI